MLGDILSHYSRTLYYEMPLWSLCGTSHKPGGGSRSQSAGLQQVDHESKTAHTYKILQLWKSMSGQRKYGKLPKVLETPQRRGECDTRKQFG